MKIVFIYYIYTYIVSLSPTTIFQLQFNIYTLAIVDL